eukprot:maker-scaffold75_size407189-snap-gene-3.16 protein:Tk10138 transcript:maker-scaffold75_size407189-snap-gene-3.16-mRNA-1 annotation:"pickpocket protein 28-like"
MDNFLTHRGCVIPSPINVGPLGRRIAVIGRVIGIKRIAVIGRVIGIKRIAVIGRVIGIKRIAVISRVIGIKRIAVICRVIGIKRIAVIGRVIGIKRIAVISRVIGIKRIAVISRVIVIKRIAVIEPGHRDQEDRRDQPRHWDQEDRRDQPRHWDQEDRRLLSMGDPDMYSGKLRKRQLAKPKDTIRSYSEVATMHGIYYVFEKEGSMLTRGLWFFIGLLLVALSLYFIISAYLSWQADPVLTTASTTGRSIYDVHFPAITICGLGTVWASFEEALVGQMLEYAKGRGIEVNNITGTIRPNAVFAKETDVWKFVEESFPGLITQNPLQIISTIASRSPDQTNMANVQVFGFDQCSDQKDEKGDEESTFTPCLWTNDIFDGYDRCYLPRQSSGNSLEFACESKYEVYDPTSNKDLVTLAGLFLNGTLTANGPFWTRIYNDRAEGEWITDNDIVVSKSNFPTIETINLDEEDDCATLTYLKSSQKFQLDSISCEDANTFGLCCYTGQEEVNCTNYEHERPVNERDIPLDSILNSTKLSEAKAKTNQLKTRLLKQYNRLNLTAAFDKIFELLWYSQLPCYDVTNVAEMKTKVSRGLLRRCEWKGVKMSCSAIFETFPTDRGMCCSFNIEKANDVFKAGKYRDMVSKLQLRDRQRSWVNTSVPRSYTQKGEPKSEAGVNKGLRLILDAHTNLLSMSSVTEDFQGFLAIVHSKGSYPLSALKNIRIRPGHENLVQMDAIKIVADDAIRSISVDKRDCYFTDELPLKFHQNYSYANCLLECSMEFAQNQTGSHNQCYPWFLPTTGSDSTFCDPWLGEKFLNAFSNIPQGKCQHCKPDCRGVNYKTSATAVPFRRCDNQNLGTSSFCDFNERNRMDPPIFGEQVKQEYKESSKSSEGYVQEISSSMRNYSENAKADIFPKLSNTNGQYDAYDKDIAVVNFYFETTSVFEFKRQARMTIIDFASQVGGFLGLCIGFSICSAFEIFYWSDSDVLQGTKRIAPLGVDYGQKSLEVLCN